MRKRGSTFRKKTRYKRYKKKRAIKNKNPYFSFLKNRIFWDTVLGLLLIVEIVYFLFFSPFFKIKETTIDSQLDVSREAIVMFLKNRLEDKIWHIFKRDNFFLVCSACLERELLSFYPQAKKVDVKKIFPDRLNIDIQKRTAEAVFEDIRGKRFLVDGEGFIFKEAPHKISSGLFLIKSSQENKEFKIGERLIEEDKMAKISLIQKEVVSRMNLPVSFFEIEKNERLNVKIKEGWEVFFDLSQNIPLALTKLQLLLEREILPSNRAKLQYIDLRFTKAYYKYK